MNMLSGIMGSKGTDFQRLYRKWGVRGFDMMAKKLGGRQMLKLVMTKTKISYLDHAKLLVWNELNPVKQKLFCKIKWFIS